MTSASEIQERQEFRLAQADYRAYHEAFASLQKKYMHYPRTVSIETQVKCNAKCGFCPYPTSNRQGEELPEDVFLKIVDDLSAIPADHAFNICLCRINEPLLDHRLEHFHSVIKAKLPSATPAFWSNGTLLRQGRFEWMGEHKNATLSISLNAVDEDNHQRLMGFGLKAVLPNLDYVHQLVESGDFPVKVLLFAPFENARQAADVERFCRQRWPLFKTSIRPFFVWRGPDAIGKEQSALADLCDDDQERALNFSCKQ